MRDKRRPPGRDGGMAELAGRQHGVVSGSQLAELGCSRHAVSRAVDAGRLHRLHRGVYAVGHTRLSWHGRCMAAALACGRGALASHRSAAWLWGITTRRPATIDVTAPVRLRPRPSISLHHARRLLAEDRAEVDGLPITSLPRTFLDLAASVSATQLDRMIERAERLQLFDLGPVEALLLRARGHHGAGRLRKALSLYRDEPAFIRSRLEERFLDLVRKQGLPAPSMNHFAEGCELDAYWPDERFAVELDSFEYHRTRAAFEEDRRRQENLKLAGIELLRVTDRRISDEPELLAERIALLLQRRRRR